MHLWKKEDDGGGISSSKGKTDAENEKHDTAPNSPPHTHTQDKV